MTLAGDDSKSKLIEVVTFADADIEESVGGRLMTADSWATS